MKKLISILIMFITSVNLMAIKKTAILEHEINNTKITIVEINDDKVGTLEEIKIELGKIFIQKKYTDDNLYFGTMGYRYFINKKQILKSEMKIFAMGVMYEITQAFGITIVSRLQMEETGYEPEAYYKIGKEITKKDYNRIEDISDEITKEEYNEINVRITNLIKSKETSIIEKIEKDTKLKIKEIEYIVSEKFSENFSQ